MDVSVSATCGGSTDFGFLPEDDVAAPEPEPEDVEFVVLEDLESFLDPEEEDFDPDFLPEEEEPEEGLSPDFFLASEFFLGSESFLDSPNIKKV